jgi:predicted acylesterase/phospholipase RssA
VKHALKKRNTMLVAVDVNGGEATERKRETKQEKEDAQYFLQRQLNGLYNYLGIRHESKHEANNDSKRVPNSKGKSEEKSESGSGVKGKGSNEGKSEGKDEGKNEGKSKGSSEGINEGTSKGKIEDNLGYIDMINRTITLMTHHMAQLSLEIHKPDIYIEVSGDSCGIFDFYKAEEMVERGRKAAAKILKGKEK